MALTPSAEVEVTPTLVRELLAVQHPDLADLPLRVVASGWDNVVLRLGHALAVRVPRRAVAATLARHEQRWLPTLAPALPVSVPAPVRVGRPSATDPLYPWPWSIVPWFEGSRVLDVPVPQRTSFATDLADVVVALHTPAPPDAPHNPVRGVALRTRTAAVLERLDSGLVARADEVRVLWTSVAAIEPWSGPPLWLHGDLHPANLLAGQGRDEHAPTALALSAVLDFGDVTAGDPATDLATAWLTFDAPGRALFRERVDAGCRYDGATWARAQGWALTMATSLLANSDDSPAMRAMGAHALAQVLDHPEPGARQ